MRWLGVKRKIPQSDAACIFCGIFLFVGEREYASELIVRLEPEGSARLVDMIARGDAEVADGRLVVADEFGVIFVEEIVDAQGKDEIVAGTVGAACRNDAEAARRAVVDARLAAVPRTIAVLLVD